MRPLRLLALAVSVLALFGLGFLALRFADAHCDTLAGPVVTDARLALEKGDVTPVLKWVSKENEEEVKVAFKKALAVRSKGPEAKELADMYFFETLVRLHRAGEGEPFTGLKPAAEVEPVVAAADKAIASGNADELARKLAQKAEQGVRERFEGVIKMGKHKDESVEAGRAYVEAYVAFVHYVEGLDSTIAGPGPHEPAPGPHAH